MKKLSALALAGLLAAPAAYAADIQFGGDVDAEYYNTRDAGDRFTGFAQRIRLQSVMDAGNGVQLHTRLNLINDRWTGDASGGDDSQTSEYSARDHRNVQLDYGFVQMPVGPGTLRIGRQMANWNHNLTTSDDRRDRISYVTRLAGQTVVLGYDQRGNADDSTRDDNQDLYFAALLGPIADTGWNYGVLYATFQSPTSGVGGAGYALRGAHLLSPYVTGAAGPVDLTIGGHYLGQSRGPVYTEDTFSVFIRGGMQATDTIRLEGQALYVDGGNLVAGGFDTYSSLIHNSPDHDLTATRIGGLNLGGFGTEAEEDDSSTLVAVRAQLALTPEFTLTPALGWVNYDRASRDVDEDVTFVDLRGDFQLNPATTVFAGVGYADAEDYLGRNVSGFTTGVNVQF